MNSNDATDTPNSSGNASGKIAVSTLGDVIRKMAEIESALITAHELCAGCPELLALKSLKTESEIVGFYLDLSEAGELWQLLSTFEKVISAMNSVTGALQLTEIAQARRRLKPEMAKRTATIAAENQNN